jgi:hypothetical protein
MLIIQFFSCPSKKARTPEQDIIIFTHFIRETNLTCPVERTVTLIYPKLLSFIFGKNCEKMCFVNTKCREVTITYRIYIGRYRTENYLYSLHFTYRDSILNFKEKLEVRS